MTIYSNMKHCIISLVKTKSLKFFKSINHFILNQYNLRKEFKFCQDIKIWRLKENSKWFYIAKERHMFCGNLTFSANAGGSRNEGFQTRKDKT